MKYLFDDKLLNESVLKMHVKNIEIEQHRKALFVVDSSLNGIRGVRVTRFNHENARKNFINRWEHCYGLEIKFCKDCNRVYDNWFITAVADLRYFYTAILEFIK